MTAWAQSLFLEPPVICGRRLLPLSLAHLVLLRELQSPYAIEAQEPRMSDILLFIEVCSHTWEENCQRLFRQNPVRKWTQWARIWGKIWASGVDYRIADASIRTYISDSMTFPAHTENESPAGGDADKWKLSAPVEWHIVRILMTQYHLSESDAWNMPINRARCYSDVYCESLGDATLVNHDEEQVREFVRQADRLAAEGKKEEADAIYHKAQLYAAKAANQ